MGKATTPILKIALNPHHKDNPHTSKPTTEESDHDSELGTGSAETEQKQIDASSRKAHQQKSNESHQDSRVVKRLD